MTLILRLINLKQLIKYLLELRVPQNKISVNSQFNTKYYQMSITMYPLNTKLY